MFGTILISACTIMHIYVFWRIASVPFVARHVPPKVLIFSGFILWALLISGRVTGHHRTGVLAGTLEFSGMTWMAVLFLTFVPILATDIVTLFGFIMPGVSSRLRGLALSAGLVLSVIACIQGLRPPVVEEYEVALPGLPADMDGKVMVALSDTHLGSLIGEDWLRARIEQVEALRPDIVVLLGDIFEGHAPPQDEMIRILSRLSAPLGVWAVNGNHENHGVGNRDLMAKAGFELLRNRWAGVRPGLVLAGVEDLTTLRRRGGGGDPVSEALRGRPPGAAVLLSHTPWQADRAARAGAGLMLCGHTHGGQIWPFDYLVRTRYPLLEGRYEVEGMTVIVCRGTGTWGPRMRLWSPGEILRVTLKGGDGKEKLARGSLTRLP